MTASSARKWAKVDDQIIFDVDTSEYFFGPISHWSVGVMQDSPAYDLLIDIYNERKSFTWTDPKYKCDLTKIGMMIHNPGKTTFPMYGILKERDTAAEREEAIDVILDETYTDPGDITEQE